MLSSLSELPSRGYVVPTFNTEAYGRSLYDPTRPIRKRTEAPYKHCPAQLLEQPCKYALTLYTLMFLPTKIGNVDCYTIFNYLRGIVET